VCRLAAVHRYRTVGPLHFLIAKFASTRPSPNFGKPIHSGYVLMTLDDLAHVTSLEHERWTRAHPEFCRKMGIR